MIRGDRHSREAAARAIVVALTALLVLALGPAAARAQVPPGCPAELGTVSIVRHDLAASFCELCEEGTVRIVVESPFDQGDGVGDLSELVVTGDLGSSGLTYVPGSTSFSGTGISVPAPVEPSVGGPDGSVLTWDLSSGGPVLEPRPGGVGSREALVIEFQVERAGGLSEEGLVLADRTIEAFVELSPECSPGDRFTGSTGPDVLPLREPEPEVIKTGRNVDAGQGAGSYSNPVYAHENDDVIWRIEVRNPGQADLQDFVFSDSIAPGNFDIDWVCDDEADAAAAAGGAAPAGCVALGGTTTTISDFDVRAAFGGGGDPYVVAPAGGSGFYYLVGVVTDSCTDRTNTVFDVEWGCQEEPPAGGIAATSTGQTAGDTAELSTLSEESGVDVDVFLEGVNRSQPMGARGTVTIRIRNLSGGTIKHDGGIRVRELLPAEYVIDPTFDPVLLTDPAYGNDYPGMIDTLQWTNPAAGTSPLTTSDPAAPLSNTELEFLLTSSTVHPDFSDQFNMIRHGDTMRVRFRTVLIDPTYYDKVADLDVRTEDASSDPPGTDPDQGFSISAQTDIWFEEFCDANGIDEHQLTIQDDDTADPEDLDVDIVGSELIFILTATGDPLPLTVALTNNGGHDAEDYEAYVTFGEAMVVQDAPAGCSPTSNPPALTVWQVPADLPASASVYRCDRGTISPGETELLTFEVVKNTAPSFDDDLTFRADVTGQITLSDGTLLWFPTPTARSDGVTDPANDYTLDGVRARVIGYNLLKEQLGVCTEDNPPPGDPDTEIQIGEECSFHVESGGWFGFQTPGFQYIAVQNIQVVDENPDGQGYLSSTDPLLQSTPAITGVTLNPPPPVLDDASFDWTFNTVVPGERITEKDHWFRVDYTTRMLNDPVDTRAAPNEHAATSTDVLTSTFEAVFFNTELSAEEVYDLGPDTVGFPREVYRRVDLTVTEPRLVVTKEVCNETLYGAGPSCSNFVPLADDGNAFHTYVYRVTVENEASSGGVSRAPAYDVTVTSVTDPGDQLFVDPLGGDSLDNDGDASVDGGDGDGEGSVTDNVPLNGNPAEVIASYTHSSALERIDAGDSVVLYYRVDPDDDVAPLQTLTSTVSAAYDSLEGASGNQSAPQGANGEPGGARQYVSDAGEATIRIIPVEVEPKAVTALSDGPPSPSGEQPVSIGEEVEFEIEAMVPVAQVRDFVIRDELPPGIRCIEAPEVDLDAPPYAAGGLIPGGTITPTCTDTEVVWNFGDQIVSSAPGGAARFPLPVRFIARVDNELANQDGTAIVNGGSATAVTVSYVDEGGSPVSIDVPAATLTVREPMVELQKEFSAALVDAGDVPRVTITATNTGLAPAYNLRLLDDLSGVDLDYVGDVQGGDPPAVDTATFGPDQPLFSWADGFRLDPGETISFSFAVEVDIAAEPDEVLENTIQAAWTSLPGQDTALNASGQIGPDGSATGMRIGVLPNAGDPLNDQESEASDSVSVPPVAVEKTDLDPGLAPEIGSHRSFEVVVGLSEGTTTDLVLSDSLDTGSAGYVLASNADHQVVYDFVGIQSINGSAPDETSFTAVPAEGATGTAVWSIGTVVTGSEDDLAGSSLDPSIRIRYRARIDNDLDTDAGDTLQNTVEAQYVDGETGAPAVVADDTPPVTATEPVLDAIKTVANVTNGKSAGDPAAFGDTLEYRISVSNTGGATAWDVNLVDTIPPEMQLDAGFTPTATIDLAPVPGFVPAPAGAPAGPLVWGRDNGDEGLDLPAGSTLELTYRVEVVSLPSGGSDLANSVWIDWTSLQDPSVYERTGQGCPTTTPPDDYCLGPVDARLPGEPLPPAEPLQKETTQPTAAIGESFRYRITVPGTPYPYAMYDVRITDDLGAAAADLRLESVARISGPGSWTPVNTGTDTSLVIQDPAGGIDIPAGEQVVLELTVVVEDTPTNTAGLTFTNTADYTFDWADDDAGTRLPGAPGTSPSMTIVEPELTLEKTGPAGMTVGTPGSFGLDVHNVGGGPAWNVTVVDRLPDEAAGGTCDTPPTAVTARVYEADGTTPASPPLAEGSDFSVAFSGAPACELTLRLLSAQGTLAADQRLLVGYQTELDVDSQDGVALTNVAGATSWFSAAGSVDGRRSYTRTLSDGTEGVLDHEDAHTLAGSLPDLRFEKTVVNLTTGADPATTATPGDVLRYRLRLVNDGDNDLDDLAVVDALDALNSPAVFEPGTLALVSVPPGADTSGTSATGGGQGTGLVDVRDLDVPAMDEISIEFDVALAGVLPDGTVAANQSQLLLGGEPFAVSDDPGANGPADPAVAGDEDPTRVTIESAPEFLVEKTSAVVTGDPDVLLAGETLRYTITVKNVGTANASDAVLRDAVPVNTQYVAGSTTLNGTPVPDGPGGTAPLSAGLPIYAPEDPTPGAMRADASATSDNVATLVFEVAVDAGVLDGRVISNQAFVSAVGGGVSDQPSDDPRTPLPDDPTRDVVGNAPLLFAPKSVALAVDGGTPGVVDPGDVLHYTIAVQNTGAVEATGVTLTDQVPADTTYVADSTTLNGLPVGQPDGGSFPLAGGLPVRSSDATPPLPGPGEGTLSPGESAVVEFDLRVDAGVPGGTLISNQAVVATTELPNLLTDGDGDPATGPEPTVVVVGDGQQLSISKDVTVVGGGAVLPGSELEYVVRVVNIGAVPALDVVVTDDLDAPVPGQLALVAGSATLNGSAAAVTVAGPVLTADAAAALGPLEPGGVLVLRFRATVAPTLATGTTVTNTAVVAWNDPQQTASASVSVDVGGMPGVGALNGTLWHDADFDRTLGGGSERLLQGWTVELYRNGQPVQSVQSGPDGSYRIAGLEPNDATGDRYALRFAAPGAGPDSAALGFADSPFTDGPQEITDIVLAPGSNLQELDLPISPNGVVYDAVERTPIAGATLTLLDAGTGSAVSESCFADPAQQGQVTLADGHYKFDLDFTDASCPSGGGYLIAVAPSGPSLSPGVSQLLPPSSDSSTPPLSVPGCPGTADDAVSATGQYCESQASERAPGNGDDTRYHLHLALDGSQAPGSSQIFNNHVPVDPVLDGAVALTKTAASLDVRRGELVPYEITVRNVLGGPLVIDLVDRFPAGFRYVEGSARIDGEPTEPAAQGRELTWSDLDVPADGTRKIALLLAAGAGVTEGEYTNRALAFSSVTGAPVAAEATATVRVVPDFTFDCTDVLGRVFADNDADGVQEKGERGIPGVRLVTTRGLVATTDEEGRFHITCAVVPREDRGSNFVLKLDDRSLPTGYRMTTRQVQVKRATRGKALRFGFGASIHRVVGLDLADAVFEPDSSELRVQWRPRLDVLVRELEKGHAILRLSYVADLEAPGLVERRLEAVKDRIRAAWGELDAYPLSIETRVYWRRGAPTAGSGPGRTVGRVLRSLLPSVDAGPPVRERRAERSAERLLSPDEPSTIWALDPERVESESGDRLEEREVLTEEAEIVKLKGVVPPIRFGSGAAEIPPSTLEMLRDVLDGMRHLENVRLHLVGHSDDEPLSERLARVYGDNAGLSRERAGEVAEFLQEALSLPPGSISYEWAGAAQPVATNATESGRGRNRRVEVEVWYDEIAEKVSSEEVVVPQEIQRVKVCRTETVCKLRYRQGHEHRARVRNLIEPLAYDESVGVPEDFVRDVARGLEDLREKQGVTVRFIGYTDDSPLDERDQRIYGTHLALSKARARRVALAVREALGLPAEAVESDGRGVTRPLASNATARGRRLNRRIEVEFGYDDPLQELPDEPLPCPAAADAELVTQVHDPASGRLEPIAIEGGEPRIPEGYAQALREALDEVRHRTRPRLRFVGYTANERLDRRTALVYGDDIGLSTARARRTLQAIQAELGLRDDQVEHEGRGYVHAEDVVNAGFVRGEGSHVAVQVVYDERALRDDFEGVQVTPITREISPKHPLALNPMRITVDGEPIDDPGRSTADIQRCTDVALDRADIRFRFDDLETLPRLSVTAHPAAARAAGAAPVRFRTYTNYGSFIERSEVRIFRREQSLRAEPLAVVPVGEDGIAEWRPEAPEIDGPLRDLRFVLRAYDGAGRFDETAAQSLWVVPGEAARGDGSAEEGPEEEARERRPDPLLAGYGESGPLARNIPLGDVGSVRVHGQGVPPRHRVWLAGSPVPVSAEGEFVAEVLLPQGTHTVEVAVLDEEGNGELFLRDLEFDDPDWFYVGMADLTLSARLGDDRPEELVGEDAPFDPDSNGDGRLAFYVTGEFGDAWRLTASADTREEPLEDLFTNFLDKSPESLFRRIDPDYHYPTFGDDGTVEETAPTSGKFYLELARRESRALWGNFEVEYLDNELAQVDRGLYGGNLHLEAFGTTESGERRLSLDAFGAEPGTVPSREEFRGTGGSLYTLRRQDLLAGSERLRIEVRDKVSGLVTGVVHLRPTVDYDIDYLQGRVLLSEPIRATVEDDLLVRSGGLSGDEAWLVVQYEYTPGFDDLDAIALGGRAHAWLGDHVKLGLTANRNDDDGADSSLYGADLTLRASAGSWLKLQAGRSEGLVSTSLLSDDGGFGFRGVGDGIPGEAEAHAYRADLSLDASDLFEAARGRLSLYGQRLEGGYSAPGMTALNDTDFLGGTLEVPLWEHLDIAAKADWLKERDGLQLNVQELDVGVELTDHWSLGVGVRHELREDDSPLAPSTLEEGRRADAVAQVGFDANGRWSAYAFGQGTLLTSGEREDNNRGGVGGSFRVSDRLALEGEVSYGDLGPAVELGTTFQETEETRRYLTYSYQDERGRNGLHQRKGTLISGVKSRISDSSSVYLEDRYEHGEVSTGLARAMGIDLAPSDRWSLSATSEIGTLIDARTDAETRRRSGGVRVAYGADALQLSSGVEYRFDETEGLDGTWSDRTTWLFRNNLRYQVTAGGRLSAKLNHSFSDSSRGEFFDGGFTEAVLGYAYRPVAHDRLHVLAKYTYFYNVPSTDQVTTLGTPVEFIQKSHVAALDVTYDLTRSFSIGAKYAYRLGQVSLDREDPEFFDNNAHLFILRADWRFRKHWEALVEGRVLDLPDLDERRAGALLTLYRQLGDKLKLGVGYNFTDFSEDLTDLSYDHHGIFINLVGTL